MKSSTNFREHFINKSFVSNTLKSILLVLTMCIATNANAQLLKKLGKKAEKAAEKTLEKKVEQKTERETDKAFDSTFNKKRSKKSKKRNPVMATSSVSPASSYSFSHKYVMQIKDGRKTTDITYFLNKSGNYIGTSIPDQKNSMLTVMDMSKETMFMFMENKGDKTMMSINFNLEQATNDAVNETNVSITPTGNSKKILNYTCKEYKVSGNDINGSVWVTQSAGISFSKAFYQTKSKKGLNQSWMAMLKGLTMEMNITDTSKRKPKTIVMTCIALERSNFTINTNNYKKLM